MRKVARLMFCIGCVCVVLTLMTGCGKWIPAHGARVNEVYPLATIKQHIAKAPQKSILQQMFNKQSDDVFEVALLALQGHGADIYTADKGGGVILATESHILDPPPDLLNCPNNHFANSKPQPWSYYIAVLIEQKSAESTLLRIVAKTQGRCFKGGGCYGYDPCGEYANVHWAVGYGSAARQLSQLMKMIESNLGQAN